MINAMGQDDTVVPMPTWLYGRDSCGLVRLQQPFYPGLGLYEARDSDQYQQCASKPTLTPPVSQVPPVDPLDTHLLSAPSEGHTGTSNYLRNSGHMITTCCGGFGCKKNNNKNNGSWRFTILVPQLQKAEQKKGEERRLTG